MGDIFDQIGLRSGRGIAQETLFSPNPVSSPCEPRHPRPLGQSALSRVGISWGGDLLGKFRDRWGTSRPLSPSPPRRPGDFGKALKVQHRKFDRRLPSVVILVDDVQWYACEKTLSIHRIDAGRRDLCYHWATIDVDVLPIDRSTSHLKAMSDHDPAGRSHRYRGSTVPPESRH